MDITQSFVVFNMIMLVGLLCAGDRQEARRHASVLMLAELARHADVIVYPHVAHILENIWVAIRDPNVRLSMMERGSLLFVPESALY